MEAAGGTTEGDEVARLCVSKLRAMLVVQGDPNLRYVALLAFAKITTSHADLVADHQDVILECIDDPDISIRTRALDLVVGMVNANNLPRVVERLLKQLRTAGTASAEDDPENDRAAHFGVIPSAEDDDEETQMSIRKKDKRSDQPPPLPEDYRQSVIERILEMCSKDSYANLDDFEWYVGVLVELVRQCPSSSPSGGFGSQNQMKSMSDRIGDELLNVAVRVKGVRPEAATAAQTLLLIENREKHFPASSNAHGVLAAAAFVAGEYAPMLPDPDAVLTSLIHSSSAQLPAPALTTYLQAVPKVFAVLTSDQQVSWTATRRTQVSLLVARVVHFLEQLTGHPSLEVQERAVEYLDLMRLASEATSSQQTDSESDGYADPPLLLTQAIPSLFTGMELNPVGPAALRKVPAPEGLDLDVPINANLQIILHQADYDSEYDSGDDEVRRFYYEKPSAVKTAYTPKSASDLLETQSGKGSRRSSYQEVDSLVSKEELERKRAERRERNKDDPYYIGSEQNSGTSTPVHNILRTSNGDLDVDAIPVMELKLDHHPPERRAAPKAAKKPKRHFEITSDETLGDDSVPASYSSSPSSRPPIAASKGKKSLLEMDSSALASLSLDETAARSGKLDYEQEEEMARAVKEVERLRLEMQRQAERIEEPEDEGTVVRRKKKKARAGLVEEEPKDGTEAKAKKKKKKKPKADEEGGGGGGKDLAAEEPVKAKKKKKRQVTFDE